MPYQKIK